MKKEQDYIQDITEIRTMMERSSKFLSLSGWAGIMAGIYALTGAYIAFTIFNFNPDEIVYKNIISGTESDSLPEVIILGLFILILALVTAIIFSWKKAHNRGEKIWNATSRRLLASMTVPLVTGGTLIIVLITKAIIGLVIPLMLLFYGLALYNASKFTIDEVKFLGITQIGLGLLSSYFIEYSLLFWSIGFGVVHIGYGIYMYFRYER
jgi:hypothetical protein